MAQSTTNRVGAIVVTKPFCGLHETLESKTNDFRSRKIKMLRTTHTTPAAAAATEAKIWRKERPASQVRDKNYFLIYSYNVYHF